MSTAQDQETFSFQAEALQIPELMIHSLYSNKADLVRSPQHVH